LLVLRGRTDGIGAPDLLAVQHGSQRQVLALGVVEGVRQRWWKLEGHGNRIARGVLHLAHLQGMELGRGHGGAINAV